MKNELPSDYHANRANFNALNLGGVQTTTPSLLTKLFAFQPNQSGTTESTAHVIGGNSPSSLHYLFGDFPPSHHFGS